MGKPLSNCIETWTHWLPKMPNLKPCIHSSNMLLPFIFFIMLPFYLTRYIKFHSSFHISNTNEEFLINSSPIHSALEDVDPDLNLFNHVSNSFGGIQQSQYCTVQQFNDTYEQRLPSLSIFHANWPSNIDHLVVVEVVPIWGGTHFQVWRS